MDEDQAATARRAASVAVAAMGVMLLILIIDYTIKRDILRQAIKETYNQ